MLPESCIYFSGIIQFFGIFSIIYGAIGAIQQTDLKKLAAYSSVSHMGLVLIGIFNSNIISLKSSILLMVSHGLVSSGIFFLIGMLYRIYGSRESKYFTGLSQTMPVYSFFFFIFFFFKLWCSWKFKLFS